VQVTLVDRRNFHLFQPLLYQVATGGLSAGAIAQPLQTVFANDAHVSVLMGAMVNVALGRQTMQLRQSTLSYETAVIATGAGVLRA
jgi:NADH:ubiquinone reductase (H+-translocating)